MIYMSFFFFFKQVVTNRDTQETLLCMACVFEVSNSEHGAQHHIYRLVKDWTWLFIYIDICIYTHICAHTHSLHYRTTDCKPHHRWCPGPPGHTLTFLNPVWVNLLFFSCVHAIIVAVKLWCSFLCIPQICKPQFLGEGESYQPKPLSLQTCFLLW